MHPKKFRSVAIACALLLPLISLQSAGREGSKHFPEIPPSVLPVAKIAYDDGQDPMGCRLFRTTESRAQINLGGFWDFLTDREDVGEAKQYFGKFPQPETQLWIPGSWNAYARYWQYQGVAWLRRAFEMPSDGNFRIQFGGIFYFSKIWLDGALLGEHEGAYTPFEFVVRNVRKGKHTLIVRADNRLNDQTLPKAGVDWFPHGGVFRPVCAESVAGSFIDNFHVLPSEISTDQVLLTVRVFVKNADAAPKEETVSFAVDGDLLYSGKHQLSGQETALQFRTVLKKPKLWSPDEPNLYSARVVLGKGEDDQFTRFGIRSFSAEGARILLNRKRFKLMGANRHDDHPDWGSALPAHIIRQDVEILKRLGANAVRGHYPPSEMFLDYCDQSGLVFMDEVPSWQYSPEQLAREALRNKIKQQYSQMVYRDMNHPSIFSWSLGNEWRDFRRAYADIKNLIEFARMVDTSHFITFVSGGADIDRSHGLVDIICTNWAQYQWYDPITYLDSSEGEKSVAKLNEIHKCFPDKPVVLTEFGGAESQAGWHNWGNVKWSEEYQARNVFDSGRYALEQDWISGGCVWQFCDTRTDPSRMLAGRLHGWNGKGIVDAYRQPKMAFYRLQELFHQF